MAADQEHESGWQTMESDPGVFTELLRSLDVPLIVDDLYSLDAESVAAMQPLHAFIFLFKWTGSGDEKGGGQGQYDDDFTGFFANQVVNNACATIAVLNGICNVPGLETGHEIENLKDFAVALDSQTRGEVITSNDAFRAAHNALSPPPSVSLAELDIQRTASDEAYHFIVYLPHDGRIYELDGLKRAPINHGAYNSAGEGWISKAREAIEARISTYPPGSLHFSILAIRDDPLPKLDSQVKEATDKGHADYAASLRQQIETEKEKRNRWTLENSLRRHNHLGTMHALLVALAQNGLLEKAEQTSKEKMAQRIKDARERGGR